MSEVKYVDLQEFRDKGYLQEVNRLFFHPLGLALEFVIDDKDGSVEFSGIWDARDDPEGIRFADGVIDTQKVANIAEENAKRAVARSKLFGGKSIQEADE